MRLRISIVPLLLASMTASAAAQEGGRPAAPLPRNEVHVTGALLISWQPPNRTFHDSLPYIDRGLGGFIPGISTGLVVRHRRAAVAVEFSTAAEMVVRQSGRSVGGQSTGGLQDSFATVLGGIDVEGVKLMAGVSRVLGWPTKNGEPLVPHADGDGRRYVPSAGLDWIAPTNSRVGFSTTLRYTLVPRTRAAFQRGVGRHVFRLGAGVSIRLSRSKP